MYTTYTVEWENQRTRSGRWIGEERKQNNSCKKKQTRTKKEMIVNPPPSFPPNRSILTRGLGFDKGCLKTWKVGKCEPSKKGKSVVYALLSLVYIRDVTHETYIII